MKHIISFLLLLAVLMSGCTKEENMGNEPTVTKGRVFTSSFENNESRTYVENGTSSRWTAGDTISLFDSNTLNLQYKFTGKTGDAGGSFVYKSKPAGEGTRLSANYAVYPYDKDMTISEEGVITLTLPSVQHYAENSYGLGANTMVAVTENTDDTSLMFKNVGACIQVRLYADEATVVKSITLTGNNEEKIAGRATITAAYGQAPEVTMADDATTSITLECGAEGVPLSNSSGEPTVFWMVVPPVTFAEGYTLTVKDVADKVFTRTTESEVILKRNGGRKTTPVKVVPQEVAPKFGMREALVKLYESTGGDSWTNKDNWCSDKPLTEWHGVSLSNGKYSVNLQNNGLTGEISQIFPDSLVSLIVNNNHLTSVNISNNKDLGYFNCYGNELTSLNVLGCTAMYGLNCAKNKLTELDVSGCISLEGLSCENNSLTSLNLYGCTTLDRMNCYNNQLTSLDVSGCTALTYLGCHENPLTSMDVSDCTLLASLNISGCTTLTSLDCSNTSLTSLNVSGFTSLITLDVSNCKSLESLSCGHNKLASLSVSGCTALQSLNCSQNQLTALNVSDCKALTLLSCYDNQLYSLDVSNCTLLTDLSCGKNKLKDLDVSKCTLLTYLDCSGNQLTSLDVSSCPLLDALDCAVNQLTSLDVSNCAVMYSLKCYTNKLTSLDVSDCAALEELDCTENSLTSLDVTSCSMLKELYCYDNQLISLKVFGCLNLTNLSCQRNQLTTLNASGCTSLDYLDCTGNPLTTLNISGCPNSISLYYSGNVEVTR